ncbi:chemotaxis protein [Brachyspira hampsonii]|uniref:Chemotaxis protein n=1 Tax=Brachyspira hampsonii TaxID=1287055 RepID=A0A1E5NG60_9SPIR|nr:methyl-accepting chemotaxis protein [Brachyspira hampsonii]OEJ15145.1 chemotaxis protein [Brachyspira hampsonii]
MNSKNNLNIKISLFILIPIVTIVLIFGIMNTIYIYKITEEMTLFIISQMSEKEIYEIENIISVELNYLDNIKYSVENLYNYNVRKREVYEDLMNRFAHEMSTNAVSVSLMFFTNIIDNDSMYINNPLYQDIKGRFVVTLVKDAENNISRINLRESDLEYTYLNTTITSRKPYITTLNYYPIQGKYKPMYTYSIPIFSKDNELIGVSSLNLSLDNIMFYEDTNGFTISLFNEKGNIMYCTTDIYSIGENITNLSDVYGSSDLENTIYSNTAIWKESYNEKTSSKYFNIFTPIHIFDDLYWGIELAVDSKADFFNHYKIIMIIWIIITAVIIILMFIIVPFVINKKILSVMNNLNDNIMKIREGDISWRISDKYLNMNDEMGNMSREIDKTIIYLNNLVRTVKIKADKISENSNNISELVYKINNSINNNEIKENHNSKIVNNVNENSKSLLKESNDLQKIIKYFRLRE